MRRDPDDFRQPFYEGMPHVRAAGPPTIKRRIVRRDSDDASDIVTLTDLQLSTHLGTHIDVPRHVFGHGKSLDEFPLASFVGPGVVIDVRRDRPTEITAEDLELAGAAIRAGDIVLLATGWSSRYRNEDYVLHPYLSVPAAEWLKKRGVKMVGIDTLSPDMPDRLRPPGYGMPAHRVLLGSDILVVENVGDLGNVVGARLYVSAVPILIPGADGAPASVLGWRD
jgi:arylformamidase